jgi:hypothetical protein
VSDNLFPDKNLADQQSDPPSAPGTGRQSEYPPSDKGGKTSDPQGSKLNNPSGSQMMENQPNRTKDDRSMEVLPLDKLKPTTEGTETILETLFNKDFVDEMRSRWNTIQVQFVDSPCSSVEQGDALVAEIMEKFSHILADQQNL